MLSSYKREFIHFSLAQKVLCFGEFKTKAGRMSPYFFNAGLFHDGESLGRLARFYAKAILDSGLAFDMLFGPAYKGIPLVTAIAIALAGEGRITDFSFNRKETKDHGEGGSVIGAPLRGRVLIVDDVISAGTSVREAVELILAENAAPCGLAIALDRQERGSAASSAVQEVECEYRIPVTSIITLDDLISYLKTENQYGVHLGAVNQYRAEYGVPARVQ